MQVRIESPYGTWKSPIDAGLVASASVRIESQIALTAGGLYWIESRPIEAGRSVIVRYNGISCVDVNPPPFSARTRVHEYGGGSFLVAQETVYFSNLSNQRIYRQEVASTPLELTHTDNLRFADSVFDAARSRLICVCEDHSKSSQYPTNTIVSVDARDGSISELISGNDFYSSPRLSADGTAIAWITWNHPCMPWACSELWVGRVARDGSVTNGVKVAGGDSDSICQPRFSADGTLYFISERSGWWNLYRYREGEVEAMCPMEAEFGSAAWAFGDSSFALESEDRVICSFRRSGRSFIGSLDTVNKRLTAINFPYTNIIGIQAREGEAFVLAAAPDEPPSIVRLDLHSMSMQVIRKAAEVPIDRAYFSLPLDIEFPTSKGLSSHAFYYGPQNPGFKGLADEKPPLVVFSHGGPTGAAQSSLSLSIQYWTSRGFAVADVNYGGSTGYGRAYRQRLDGNWGIVDVDDCANCARYLIRQGWVDSRRIAIRGGSAGGYTTLAALTFTDVFKAGASYYGVSDLESLERETHKFESRYLDGLVGPYPGRKDLFEQRSPIRHVDRLSCPVIFFQGDEDKVVPPNQAKMMVDALRRKGLPVAYMLFKGEQHGFRQAVNIQRALESELYFYSKVFRLNPPDGGAPVLIENFK